MRTVAAIEAAAAGDLSRRVVPSGNSELRRMADATNVEDVASVAFATKETNAQLQETIRVAHALERVSVELNDLVSGFRY